MTCEEVYKAVRDFTFNHEHKFENVYVHAWEADHFSVTKGSGYAYEIEVKVSRSDFFADFKKPKHHFFKSYKRGFGIMREGESWVWNEDKVSVNNISALKIDYSNAPSKFFYAVPVGLVEEHEVPEYAGLIYVMDSGAWRVIRKAPYLHKDRFVAEKMLFSKYMYGFLDQRFRIGQMEFFIENLKKALKNPEKYDIDNMIKKIV